MKKETSLTVIVGLMIGILLSDNRLDQIIMLIFQWFFFFLLVTAKENKNEIEFYSPDSFVLNFSKEKTFYQNRKLERIMFNLGDKTYKITAEELKQYEKTNNS